MARLDSAKQSLVAHVLDIVKIEGFLQEPSGYNAEGEFIALNFATGEPDWHNAFAIQMVDSGYRYAQAGDAA